MEKWAEIRRRVLNDEISKRAACSEYGIHWDTLKKVLTYTEPPGYRRSRPRASKLEPFLPIIHEILESDRKVHRKQRHTAKRIFERLRDEHGYEGGKTIVQEAVAAWKQKKREVFLPLSHFLFEDHFCLVRRANEKGHVERLLDFARRNFLVPIPRVDSLQTLNRQLEQQCREDLKRRLRGKQAPKKDLLAQEQQQFLRPLPKQSFEGRRLTQGKANSLSLVRFDNNSYSVPTQYAYRPITIVATVDEVRLVFEDRLIARHRRHWGREQFFYDPVHYLAVLERKPGGFDHARPLENWDLPVCFGVLRRRLEAEFDGPGTREFIKVLRLLERRSLTAVKQAVQHGLEIGATSADAIRVILEYQQEEPIGLFCLDGRPQLKLVRVAQTNVSAYQALLIGG